MPHLVAAVPDRATVTPGCRHRLNPGLSDVDTPHWVPFMMSEELGVDGPKLALDPATGELHEPTVVVGDWS